MAVRHTENVFQEINGVRLPSHYKNELIYSGMNYVAQPDDIFIVTFPKSGTTWMETIVFGLLNNGRSFDDDMHYYMAQTPYLDKFGQQCLKKMTRPGSIKTHLPFDYIPFHSQAKYICIIRNPKDVCVSLYKFVVENPQYTHFNAKFDRFFEDFIIGNSPFGNYFEYIRSLWGHKDNNNVLLLSYEQMQDNIAPIIQQVAQFIGVELHNELLQQILIHSSFDYMKKKFDKARNSVDEQQSDKMLTYGVPLTHVRKGIIGDWSSYMSNEQSQRVDNIINDMKHSMRGLDFLWRRPLKTDEHTA